MRFRQNDCWQEGDEGGEGLQAEETVSEGSNMGGVEMVQITTGEGWGAECVVGSMGGPGKSDFRGL